MPLSEEEQKKILESPPKGTWFLIMIIGLIFTLAWLYMYFGLFLGRGPVA